MKIIRTPHDRFIKAMMQHSEVAKDFFKSHLPREVLEKIDLTTLKMESISFIDPQLKEYESDLIFSVSLINQEEALLYCLIEHQSRPDPLMAFRLQFYVMQGLKRYILQNKSKPLPLPLIFSLVLYNGKHPYNYSRDIFTLFGDLEPLARQAFLKPFTLIDVAKIPEQELRKHQLAGLMELSLCHTEVCSLVDEMRQLGMICQNLQLEATNEIIELVVHYCMKKRKFNAQELEEYIQLIETMLPENVGEIAMNIAQAFEARGKTEGINDTLLAMELLAQGKSLEEIENLTHISRDILLKISEKFLINPL